MSKQGTASKRICVILMTPQKLEVNKRLESGTSQSCYDIIQH